MEQTMTTSSKIIMNILDVYKIAVKSSIKCIIISQFSPIHEYSSLILSNPVQRCFGVLQPIYYSL